jgi:hypothetical protein
MMKPSWVQVKEEFRHDGSLRDIYVLDADIECWQRVLDALRSATFPIWYRRGESECVLPVAAADAFSGPDDPQPLLSVDLGGLGANSHFYSDTEIEFDFWPQDVVGQREFECVLEFMRLLADASGRECILTPENQRDIAILRYLPAERRFQYLPFGGFE